MAHKSTTANRRDRQILIDESLISSSVHNDRQANGTGDDDDDDVNITDLSESSADYSYSSDSDDYSTSTESYTSSSSVSGDDDDDNDSGVDSTLDTSDYSAVVNSDNQSIDIPLTADNSSQVDINRQSPSLIDADLLIDTHKPLLAYRKSAKPKCATGRNTAPSRPTTSTNKKAASAKKRKQLPRLLLD